MSRHRAEVRPRYGRIALLASSLAVTGIAVLGGTGVISPAASETGNDRPSATKGNNSTPDPNETSLAPARITAGSGSPDTTDVTDLADTVLPSGSGSGRRIVFSESRQRVWLVDGGKHVARTYLVSGSKYDNLDPGTYSVYSRSEQAYGVDDSGTMRYFVRFTQGDTAAIGFHDIPINEGKKVQTVAQLGTPLSHGCIRQRRPDAIALWEFAPLGTTVVVTV
ncbi:L,D-transpeptidase [Nocardioides sp.]|uniref:L,D-transpeptidase n=1 Tax=Nocardioides sp. TaxID=35761 RepID=UPI0031FEBE1D|nr:ErfK/YbiS/YcfS/YnhG family protein [Nocardioides sp.]MCW2794778.1 ErfK/YbiS/YcfS/YnhG family protein [Nocardioides sp.]